MGSFKKGLRSQNSLGSFIEQNSKRVNPSSNYLLQIIRLFFFEEKLDVAYRKLHSNHPLKLLEEKANHKVGIWLENMLTVKKNEQIKNTYRS